MVHLPIPTKARYLAAWLILCGLVTPVTLAADAKEQVTRTVDGREGPGSYYPPVMRLLRGAVVTRREQQRGWSNVLLDQDSGWVPSRALEPRQGSSAKSEEAVESSRGKELFKRMTQTSNSGVTQKKISWVQVTAAIRGFALSYTASRVPGEPTDRVADLSKNLEPSRYERFLSHRFKDRSRADLASLYLIRDEDVPGIQPDSDKVGMAIANAVSQRGLVRNPEVEAYLSQVATLVAESSHVYELPVRVFLLNQDQPVGFIAPNGVVFVSVGALEMMETEAEFAFFVGHEVAHIALAHGIKNSNEQQLRIREADAFAELDRELGWDDPNSSDRYVRTAQELGEMADQIFELLRAENQQSWEHAADRWGIIYAYRAGYRPESAVSLLSRIAAASEQARAAGIEGESRMLWRQTPVKERINRCKHTLAELETGARHLSFESEFQKQRGRLRSR